MLEFLDRSHTNAEKFRAKKRLFDTEEVYPMWVADMDIASPQCVNDALSKRLEHNIFGYEMIEASAIEAQVAWCKKVHDLTLDSENISVSPSVVSSIANAIRAFSDEGDEVIVFEPVYRPFFTMVKKNSRKLLLHSLKQDSDGIYRFDIDKLEKEISPKTKILLFCSPHNPVGRVWDEDELRALADLCDRHNLTIISDEIHSDIVYKEFASMVKIAPERTILLFGPGKTFNISGLSISSVYIKNRELKERFDNESEKAHLASASTLSYVAFKSVYSDGYEWYRNLLEHLKTNRDYISERLKNSPIKYTPPEATYLAWLDCRELGLGDRELREFFSNRVGLGLNAGLSFGEGGSGFMRLNFAVSHDILEMAMDKIIDAL